MGYQVLFLANLEGINLLPRSDVVSIDISFSFDCFLCILFITAIFQAAANDEMQKGIILG